MRAVPMSEFKDRFSDFLSAAEGGEEIFITRDEGQPPLRLVLARGEDEIFERQRAALERMVQRREALRAQGVRVSAAEVREWIDEGRP